MYDLDKVNEFYPEAIMYPAMKIWSLPKNKTDKLSEICESGEYFGQIKRDGFFYQFNKTENHSYLFSRNESVTTGLLSEKIENVPHIKQALSCLPKDTVLIGEIYVPGGTSKDTTRIMGCLPSLAIERQEEEGNIHFYVHDIIAFNGVSLLDKPALQRYEVLSKVFETFNLESDFIELAKAEFDDLFIKIAKSLEDGEEGMVLKNKTAVYSPGKKPAWSAIKCKQVDYADVICIGMEEATKEYEGKEIEDWQYWENKELGTKVVGSIYGTEGYEPITKAYYFGWKTSIVIGAYNSQNEIIEIGTVSSGLTDELKQDLSLNPDKYMNQVFMVECMSKDNEALTLRHPRFKGFRIDKNADECTVEEIFA